MVPVHCYYNKEKGVKAFFDETAKSLNGECYRL